MASALPAEGLKTAEVHEVHAKNPFFAARSRVGADEDVASAAASVAPQFRRISNKMRARPRAVAPGRGR